MKKILLVLFLVENVLSNVNTNPSSYQMGYSISSSDINNLLTGLVESGGLNQANGSSDALIWPFNLTDGYDVTFTGMSATLVGSNQSIGLNIKMRVHNNFSWTVFGWGYTNDYSFTVNTTVYSSQQPDGGVQIFICPQPLSTGSILDLSTSIEYAINKVLAKSTSCVDISSLSAVSPSISSSVVQGPTISISDDEVSLGYTVTPYTLKDEVSNIVPTILSPLLLQ